jgi:hypothetical protein
MRIRSSPFEAVFEPSLGHGIVTSVLLVSSSQLRLQLLLVVSASPQVYGLRGPRRSPAAPVPITVVASVGFRGPVWRYAHPAVRLAQGLTCVRGCGSPRAPHPPHSVGSGFLRRQSLRAVASGLRLAPIRSTMDFHLQSTAMRRRSIHRAGHYSDDGNLTVSHRLR